jgi:hypothetical protein
MEIKTLKELENFKKEAHDLLIKTWSELSKISEKSAKKDLKENIGSDYKILADDIGIRFTNEHSGESLFYSGGYWN